MKIKRLIKLTANKQATNKKTYERREQRSAHREGGHVDADADGFEALAGTARVHQSRVPLAHGGHHLRALVGIGGDGEHAASVEKLWLVLEGRAPGDGDGLGACACGSRVRSLLALRVSVLWRGDSRSRERLAGGSVGGERRRLRVGGRGGGRRGRGEDGGVLTGRVRLGRHAFSHLVHRHAVGQAMPLDQVASARTPDELLSDIEITSWLQQTGEIRAKDEHLPRDCYPSKSTKLQCA